MPGQLVEYYIDILEFLDQLSTVDEFYLRVCNLKDLILENDPTYKESYFVACFIQGLTPVIADYVRNCVPHTLHSAYETALHKELELNHPLGENAALRQGINEDLQTLSTGTNQCTLKVVSFAVESSLSTNPCVTGIHYMPSTGVSLHMNASMPSTEEIADSSCSSAIMMVPAELSSVANPRCPSLQVSDTLSRDTLSQSLISMLGDITVFSNSIYTAHVAQSMEMWPSEIFLAAVPCSGNSMDGQKVLMEIFLAAPVCGPVPGINKRRTYLPMVHNLGLVHFSDQGDDRKHENSCHVGEFFLQNHFGPAEKCFDLGVRSSSSYWLYAYLGDHTSVTMGSVALYRRAINSVDTSCSSVITNGIRCFDSGIIAIFEHTTLWMEFIWLIAWLTYSTFIAMGHLLSHSVQLFYRWSSMHTKLAHDSGNLIIIVVWLLQLCILYFDLFWQAIVGHIFSRPIKINGRVRANAPLWGFKGGISNGVEHYSVMAERFSIQTFCATVKTQYAPVDNDSLVMDASFLGSSGWPPPDIVLFTSLFHWNSYGFKDSDGEQNFVTINDNADEVTPVDTVWYCGRESIDIDADMDVCSIDDNVCSIVDKDDSIVLTSSVAAARVDSIMQNAKPGKCVPGSNSSEQVGSLCYMFVPNDEITKGCLRLHCGISKKESTTSSTQTVQCVNSASVNHLALYGDVLQCSSTDAKLYSTEYYSDAEYILGKDGTVSLFLDNNDVLVLQGLSSVDGTATFYGINSEDQDKKDCTYNATFKLSGSNGQIVARMKVFSSCWLVLSFTSSVRVFAGKNTHSAGEILDVIYIEGPVQGFHSSSLNDFASTFLTGSSTTLPGQRGLLECSVLLNHCVTYVALDDCSCQNIAIYALAGHIHSESVRTDILVKSSAGYCIAKFGRLTNTSAVSGGSATSFLFSLAILMLATQYIFCFDPGIPYDKMEGRDIPANTLSPTAQLMDLGSKQAFESMACVNPSTAVTSFLGLLLTDQIFILVRQLVVFLSTGFMKRNVFCTTKFLRSEAFLEIAVRVAVFSSATPISWSCFTLCDTQFQGLTLCNTQSNFVFWHGCNYFNHLFGELRHHFSGQIYSARYDSTPTAVRSWVYLEGYHRGLPWLIAWSVNIAMTMFHGATKLSIHTCAKWMLAGSSYGIWTVYSVWVWILLICAFYSFYSSVPWKFTMHCGALSLLLQCPF